MRTRALFSIGSIIVTAACTSGDSRPAAATGDSGTPDSGIAIGDARPAPDTGPAAACPEGHPMGDFYGKPTVDVWIGEHGPFTFVYDTGAPYSGMDHSVQDVVGAGPYEVGVGGISVELAYIRSFDAAAFGFDGIEGVIGGDVMGRYAVTLDPMRSRFWLDETRDDAALSACDHVEGDPVETDVVINQYLYVRGAAEDEDGWFLVDSGASLGAMPDGIFDTLQARRERPYLGGFYTPAAIGTFWARLTTVAHLEVAGRRVEHITTRTLPDRLLPTPVFSDGQPLLGVLPSGYLRRFLITVDHPRATLRLDAYSGVALRDETQFFPVGIALDDSLEAPIRVAQVLAGSAAEEQGIEVGDEILRVDGRAMAALTPAQRPWSLVRPGSGAIVEVVVRRGDGPERAVSLETRDLLTVPGVGD